MGKRFLSILVALTFLVSNPIYAGTNNKLSADTKLDEEKFLAVSNALSSLLSSLNIITTQEKVSTETLESIKIDFAQSFIANQPQADPSHYTEHLKIAYYPTTKSFYIYSTSPRNGPGVVYCIYPQENEAKVPIIQDVEAFRLSAPESIGRFKVKVLTKTPSIEAKLRKLSRDYQNLLLADVGTIGKGRPKQNAHLVHKETLSGDVYGQLFNLVLEEIQLRLGISNGELEPAQISIVEHVINHLPGLIRSAFNSIVETPDDYLFGFADEKGISLGNEFFNPDEDLHMFLTAAIFHEAYHSLRHSDPHEDEIHREAVNIERILFKENFSSGGDSYLGRAVRRKIESKLARQTQRGFRLVPIPMHNPQPLVEELIGRIAEIRRRHGGGSSTNGLISANFNVDLEANICDIPFALRENTQYAIRCLFHAACSGVHPNMDKINDFFNIFSERCIGRYGSIDRTRQVFTRNLDTFRQLGCFQTLESFPSVHIQIKGSLENIYIEGIYPALAEVSKRSDGIYIYVPNRRIASQLSYRNIMTLLLSAITRGYDSSLTGSLDPEGIYDPAFATLVLYCWDVGPSYQMGYYTEEERDSIVNGIDITSLGAVSREEARQEKEQVMGVLRDMLTSTEGWPWHLFYNYILATFQGRSHSRGKLRIEIYDTTVHPPIAGGMACYVPSENKIYINRFALWKRRGRLEVQAANWFTTDCLASMLLEEIFHGDSDMIRAREDMAIGGIIIRNLEQAGIVELLSTGQINEDIANESMRSRSVRDLHNQTQIIRQEIRNREIRRLLGPRYRGEFYDRNIDIEHKNILNLIGDWFYQKKLREVGKAQAQLIAETLGSQETGVSAALSANFESVWPLIVLDGKIYAADLRIRKGDNRYTIFTREEEGGVRKIGECEVVKDGLTNRFLFTFEAGYEYFRLSSDILTAVTNLIKINDLTVRGGRITVHIDDLPDRYIPFSVIHNEDGSLERVYAECKPETISGAVEVSPGQPSADSDFNRIEIDGVVFEISRDLTSDYQGLARRISGALGQIRDSRLTGDREFDSDIDRLKGAVRDISRFRIILRQTGPGDYLISSSFSNNTIVIEFDIHQASRLLGQLDNGEFGFLIINTLLQNERLDWRMEWIKDRITEHPLSEMLSEHIFPANAEGDADEDVIIVETPIPYMQGLGKIVARVHGNGNIEYGILRGGNFCRLPKNVQKLVPERVNTQILSHPDVLAFLLGLEPILISRENREVNLLGKHRKNDIIGFVPATLGERIGETTIDTDKVLVLDTDVNPDVVSEMQLTAGILQRAFRGVLSKYQDVAILQGLMRDLKAKNAQPKGFSFISDPDFIAQTLPPNFHLPDSDIIAFDTDTARLLPPEQAQLLFAMAVVHELGHLAGMNEKQALGLTLAFMEILDASDRELLDRALENPYLDGSGLFKEFIKSAGRGRDEKDKAIQTILSLDNQRANIILKWLENGLFKGVVNRIALESELMHLEKTFVEDPTPLMDLTIGLPSSRMAQLELETPIVAGILKDNPTVKLWHGNRATIKEVTGYIRRISGYRDFSRLSICNKLNTAGEQQLKQNQAGLKIYYDVSALMEMDSQGNLKAKTSGWNELVRLLGEVNKEKKPEDRMEIALVSPWDRETTLRAFYSIFDASIVCGREGNTIEGVSEIISTKDGDEVLRRSVSQTKKLIAGITVNEQTVLANNLRGRAILANPYGSLSLIEQTTIIQALAEKRKEALLSEGDILEIPIIQIIFEQYRNLLEGIYPIELKNIFVLRNGILYFNLPPVCMDILEQLNDSVTTKISERYA